MDQTDVTYQEMQSKLKKVTRPRLHDWNWISRDDVKRTMDHDMEGFAKFSIPEDISPLRKGKWGAGKNTEMAPSQIHKDQLDLPGHTPDIIADTHATKTTEISSGPSDTRSVTAKTAKS